MKPVFDEPNLQRLYEEGHPFFVKWAELKSWTREDLEVRLANSLLNLKSLEQSGWELGKDVDYLLRQLDQHGANMEVITAELDSATVELASKHEARQRPGFVTHEKTGKKAVRDKAREEWPNWQPADGERKTVAAFYDYFEKIHGSPADESRMRKWLK